MPIIDTHCHYNMPPLADSWREHWQKAQQHGVAGGVIVGVDIETSNLALTIAAQEVNLLASIGAHPTDAQDITVDALTAAGKHWLGQDFAAVGETGLDYFRLNKTGQDFAKLAKQQKDLFRWHIQFAHQADKPLIVHVRDKDEQAYWEVLEILKKDYQGNKPFVLHCASGPLDYIKQAIKLGGYIGFDGNLTYPNTQNIRELVKAVPADRLLIETDAPYLAPQAHRGQVCEPWMIADTAKFVQEELQLDLDQILANSQRFFDYSFGQ